MDELESKLGSILENPEMMQKIMSLAQTLGKSEQEQPKKQEAVSAPALPDLDVQTLQKLSKRSGQTTSAKNQKNV